MKYTPFGRNTRTTELSVAVLATPQAPTIGLAPVTRVALRDSPARVKVPELPDTVNVMPETPFTFDNPVSPFKSWIVVAENAPVAGFQVYVPRSNPSNPCGASDALAFWIWM
jgi:hypothetical protein